MDILYRRVVHTSRASRLGVEGTLEHAAEDGGRNLAPVEVERGVLQERVAQLVGELRNVYLLGEETAIGIREGGEVWAQVLASLVSRGVEHFEETEQFAAHRESVELCQVVVKLVALAEDARILGIEAEHQAHT